ncbi:MAG: FKBP-type peptidyl-prolyl cis-trans isomerase [Thermoanaerobaculia bacterium]|jgi:FKBP-type peptidyl-prolyl cis-trans isomerase|nr:FKBP-type peptidyl-prolyl cis-trans isomerase [Thermoanaerobaculia bacterium]MBP9823922.1 FKBP-type peptidyl-prolyl cis-trans isomerase [Thermoanaerobaculia bacterium]
MSLSLSTLAGFAGIAFGALSLAGLAFAKPPGDTQPGAAAPEWKKNPSGLELQELKVGEGAEARSGMTVEVHYTGWLLDGTKFDSSLDRGKPFSFHLGAGEVIRGWDEGVAGMKVGGKRKLRIPAEMGYGARGAGGVIPGNATLVFDVELLGVK